MPARAREQAKRLVRDEGFSERDVAAVCLFRNAWQGRTPELAVIEAEGGLVETNSATFKGMDRAALVLGLDLDPTKATRSAEAARAAYVAATRARSLLVIVGDPAACANYGMEWIGRALKRSAARGRN